jgi:menaquinone-9 beta-reductase
VQKWDVVVVGAGPAGSAAALAATRAEPRSRVLLLDRAVFPRDKVCGDGVAPETFDLLADLGVADVAAGHAPVPTLRLVGPRGGQARRRMARPASVVPRTVLDARLVEAALQSGVEMDRRTVRGVSARRDSVTIDDEIEARVVIGADGAGSVVRRAAETRRPPAGHTAVAIRGYASESPTVDEQLIVMDEADRWPAYAWSFPLADGTGRANVGYGVLVDPRRPAQRRALVERLHSLLPWASTAERWRGHLLPLSSWTPRQPRGRLLLAGDAAHLVNPLTGEGIWYAVLTGMLAGQAAVGSHDPGSRYRADLRRHLGGHLRHVRLLARLGRTPRLVDAGVRAAAADQGAFDDLVDLGLTDGRVTSRLLARTAASTISGGRSRPTWDDLA